MSAPPAASPPRWTDRATAAIARPPAPNWLSVPLEVITASGRWVAMWRNPAAIVRSIEACGSPATGRSRSGIVPIAPSSALPAMSSVARRAEPNAAAAATAAGPATAPRL